RPDCAGQRGSRPGRPEHAADLRVGLLADCVEPRRAMARRRGGREPSGGAVRDADTGGTLWGTRMVLNEFVAYSQLGPLKATLDPKSFTIATFALCGFANFSSIGIQIGGIGAVAANRRHDLARLGLRAMFAGTLANFMTATIAGFLLSPMAYYDQVKEAADAVRARIRTVPEIAIVLGSGLGDFAN